MPAPPTWILESKIARPAAPVGWVRPALVPAGEPLPAALLLVAGPGYGKTRALAAIATQEAQAGAIVAWVGLDEGDADSATVFHYLLASLRTALPGFGEELEAGLADEDPRGPWTRLLRALAAYGAPVLLALDDAHHLPAPMLKAILAGLDAQPPAVRLALGTRRKLAVPLARAQATGKLKLFGPERLRFDPDETRAFLAARAGTPEPPAAWLAAAEALDGWPLGLELLTHGVDAAQAGAAGDDAVAAFVAEELFQVQPPERRAFMLQAAILQALAPEAIAAAFGRDDAAAQLEALEAELLVERLASPSAWGPAAAGGWGSPGLRFPPYLEAFLRAEGERRVPAAERAAWHRGALAYYLAEQRPELALPHAAAIPDWPAALAAGQACFPAMLATGRLQPLERCLARIPADVQRAEPAAALWRGQVASRRGQHQEAEALFEQARAGYSDREDVAGGLKATVRLAGIALLSRDMPRFGKLAMQALGQLALGRPEDVADLNLMRALAAEQRGDMGLMRECNEAVLELPVGDDVEVATCRTIALLNLFTAAFHAGDLDLARRRIDEAAEIAEAWRFFPYHMFAEVMRAQLRLTAGDVAEAGAILRALPPGVVDAMDWHDRACALTVQGDYLAATGDDRAGEELLRKASAVFAKADFPEGLKVPLERLMWLAIRRKQPARARELFREAGEPAEATVYDLLLGVAHARALHLDGELQAASEAWARLLPALADQGAQLVATRAGLYQAATLLKQGANQAAKEAWDRAAAAIARHGWGFLRETDRALWDELRPLDPTPRGGTGRLVLPAAMLATPSVPTPTPAPTPTPDPAPDPAPATPAPAADDDLGLLDLRLLGAFEIFQGPLRLDAWPRKKARLILAALALYPRGLTAEQLAEAIGEDTGTPAFLASVRVNVMTLRKILEPDMGRREGSRYVLFESEKYLLAPDVVAHLDWRIFEQNLAEGERLKVSDPKAAGAAIERALAAYRGNLLEDGSLAQSFEAEREQFRRKALNALVWLAEQAGRQGHAAGEGTWLMRAAAIAPCEEEIYIRLMRHHLASGRPERVRQAYWDCRKAFKTRLGITPGEALETAFRELAGAR